MPEGGVNVASKIRTVATLARRSERLALLKQAYLDLKTAEQDSRTYLPALERGLADRAVASSGERLVDAVARLYRAAKEHARAGAAPYQVRGEWVDYLAERERLYLPLERGDLEAADKVLSNFWRSDLGAISANYDYFRYLATGDESTRLAFLGRFASDLAVWRRFFGDDLEELTVPAYGNAWGVELDGVLVVPQAVRFDRNAKAILDMVADVSRPIVAEIGGGYGGLAAYLLARRDDLVYVDFDLPETLALAAYYLAASFPERRILWFDNQATLFREELEGFDIVLMPHTMLPALEDRSVDVFHNAISLSEMNQVAVEEYVAQVQRATRRFFYHVNIDVPGVIHRGFERIPASRFPIDRQRFRLLMRSYDPYFGPEGDYCEFLYQRIGEAL